MYKVALKAEVVRGTDGLLYLRSSDVYAIQDIADELNLPVESAGGYENAIQLKGESDRRYISYKIDRPFLMSVGVVPLTTANMREHDLWNDFHSDYRDSPDIETIDDLEWLEKFKEWLK